MRNTVQKLFIANLTYSKTPNDETLKFLIGRVWYTMSITYIWKQYQILMNFLKQRQNSKTVTFQALGVFGLCQIKAFTTYLKSKMPKENFEVMLRAITSTVLVVIMVTLAILIFSGKVSPWTGRFYSLLDPSYAKNNIPIIASVSEHQPTSWSSFYFDLQVSFLLCFWKKGFQEIFEDWK